MKSSSINASLDKGCLSATFIKMIALLCMTIDHIAAYSFEIAIIGRYSDLMRSFGRIAAPIFLYFVIESYKKTSNKERFLLRLYIAACIVGLCNYFASTVVLQSTVTFGNILHTFVWTIAIVYLFERLKKAYASKNYKSMIFSLCIAAIIVIALHYIEIGLLGLASTAATETSREIFWQSHKIFLAFFNSPRQVDYSFGFVALGVIWYLQKTKLVHCISFAGLWFVLGTFTYASSYFDVNYLHDISLPVMVIIVALIAIYNGERGRGMKYFFYIYYPVHCYIIVIVTKLMGYL